VVEVLPERACGRTVLISRQLAITRKQTVACTTRGAEHVGQTYAIYTETDLHLYTVATDYQRLPLP